MAATKAGGILTSHAAIGAFAQFSINFQKITFAKPLTAAELLANGGSSGILEGIIEQARELLPLHTPSPAFQGES